MIGKTLSIVLAVVAITLILIAWKGNNFTKAIAAFWTLNP